MRDPAPASRTDVEQSLRPAATEEKSSGIFDTFLYAQGKTNVIPLWVGEGDLATPKDIRDAATRSLELGETFYTWQRGIPELRSALARYHERLYGLPLSSENFFVCQGGMQAIQLILQAILSPGEEVVLPTPAWPNYAAPLRLANMRPVEVPMAYSRTGWQLDLDRLFSAVTPRTKALLMNTPSNPLGRVMSKEEILAVRDFCRARGMWIIADEVYARFYFPAFPANDTVAPSFLQFCDPNERIVFCNTFSKNWAMTGWRVGWIIAPSSLGQVIENLVQYNTSGTTTFLQKACIVALDSGEEFLSAQIARARRGRDIICDALSTSPGVHFARPEGAFYLFFRIDGEENSRTLSRRLIDDVGVGCAPGSAFGGAGEGWLRLCFARNPDHLAEAARRLSAWLAARKS